MKKKYITIEKDPFLNHSLIFDYLLLQKFEMYLCKEMSIGKTKTYLENTLNEIIYKVTIIKIFSKFRETIKKYFVIAYIQTNV